MAKYLKKRTSIGCWSSFFLLISACATTSSSTPSGSDSLELIIGQCGKLEVSSAGTRFAMPFNLEGGKFINEAANTSTISGGSVELKAIKWTFSSASYTKTSELTDSPALKTASDYRELAFWLPTEVSGGYTLEADFSLQKDGELEIFEAECSGTLQPWKAPQIESVPELAQYGKRYVELNLAITINNENDAPLKIDTISYELKVANRIIEASQLNPDIEIQAGAAYQFDVHVVMGEDTAPELAKELIASRYASYSFNAEISSGTSDTAKASTVSTQGELKLNPKRK